MQGVLLCLATKKGLAVLNALHATFPELPKRVCTFEETGVVESAHAAIRELADAHHYPHHAWPEIRAADGEWFRAHGIDTILLVGWRYLLPAEALRALPGRVLVAHDSLLPKYRGFAPLVTALLRGDERVGVTFLHAVQEVDAGDVVFQAAVEVDERARIADLIEKVTPLYRDGAVHVVGGLMAGELAATPQRHEEATFSIWRDAEDYFVDWHQPAALIERHIRASGRPYAGARCRWGEEVVLLEAAAVEPEVPFAVRQPGKVWRLTQRGEPVVVCGEGLLRIRAATVDDEPLVPMKRLRVRFG